MYQILIFTLFLGTILNVSSVHAKSSPCRGKAGSKCAVGRNVGTFQVVGKECQCMANGGSSSNRAYLGNDDAWDIGDTEGKGGPHGGIRP